MKCLVKHFRDKKELVVPKFCRISEEEDDDADEAWMYLLPPIIFFVCL